MEAKFRFMFEYNNKSEQLNDNRYIHHELISKTFHDKSLIKCLEKRLNPGNNDSIFTWEQIKNALLSNYL
jgi:hypothetical protein